MKPREDVLFLLILGIIFTFSSIIIITINQDFIERNNKLNSEYTDDLKISAVSGKIHIINNSGWIDFKSDGNCTGSGTYSDPYIIEDLIIDGGGSGNCILIENSDVYFQIENCKIYNSGSDYFEGDAGIKINNTINGKLINNSVSNNNYNGICIWNSNNYTISGNTVNDNKHHGICLENSNYTMISGNTANNNRNGIEILSSNNNTIWGNTANNNFLDGIGLVDSHNNTILGNIANNDKAQYSQGVSLVRSNNNQISENTLNNNQIGIYLLHSSYNIITNNILLGNTQSHWVVSGDCIGNVFSGNTIPVNKWPLIIILTVIGCCLIAVLVIVGVIIVRKRTKLRREEKREEEQRLEKKRAEILIQLTHESKREGILNCFYHPEREANTKCEKCGKLICLECKQAFSVTHGTDDSQYSTRYEYCQICYFDHKIKTIKYSPIACGFFIIFFVSGLVMAYSFYSTAPFNEGGISFEIILLSIGLIISIIMLLYVAIVYRPKKIASYEDKKGFFLNSLKKAPSLKEEKPLEIICSECGNQLDPEVSVCNYCGNLIKESSLEATIPISVEEETRDLNVFLSYSTLDTDYFQISKIVRRLEFYPEINDVLFWEEDSKQNIVEFMEETLDKTQVFVLFCSENSKKSKAVKGEWQSAYQMVKAGLMKIIPVYEDQDHIPKLLWQMLNVRFTKDNFDEFIEKLYKEIIR